MNFYLSDNSEDSSEETNSTLILLRKYVLDILKQRIKILDPNYKSNNKKKISEIQRDLILNQESQYVKDRNLSIFWIIFLVILNVYKKSKEHFDENIICFLICENLNSAFSQIQDQELKHILSIKYSKMDFFQNPNNEAEFNLISSFHIRLGVVECFNKKIDESFKKILNMQVNAPNMKFWKYMNDILDQINEIIKLSSINDQCNEILVESLKRFRIDKNQFESFGQQHILPHTILIGFDGGIYMLLNSTNSNEEKLLFDYKNIRSKYIKKKLEKEKEKEKLKINIGEGSSGSWCCMKISRFYMVNLI